MAFLSGLGFCILLVPVNRWLAIKIGKLSTEVMAHKDQRVKVSEGQGPFSFFSIKYDKSIEEWMWHATLENIIMGFHTGFFLGGGEDGLHDSSKFCCSTIAATSVCAIV